MKRRREHGKGGRIVFGSPRSGGREADARVKIDAMLSNAGWRAEQIEREGARYQEQQKSLRGKQPDYVLYAEGSRPPIAVIEAKRENANLRDAISQALNYAKLLRCGIAFASDGNIIVSAHVSDGKPLVMGDTEISSFLPEKHLRNFKDSRVWDRGEGFAASGDLVKVFASARKHLNSEGIAKMDAFKEFANLVFIKILTELHEDGGEMFHSVPAKWGDFADMAGESLMREYRRALSVLNKHYDGGFEQTQIRTAKVLESMVGLVAARSFIDTDSDIKGGAYEYFLRDYTKGKDELNRYFTPRHIVKMMVALANPQNGERVYDPFCGTGGMLIESFRHMRRQLPSDGEKRRRLLSHLRQHSLYGRDISETAHVAKMNMILSGDGHSNISRGDSTDSNEIGKHDVVITNIPFSAPNESIYIQCCLNAVRGRKNGRAAIIVPERIVCEPQYAALRKEILSEWKVERVVSLTRDVFAEYTNAKTSVLFVSWKGAGNAQKTVPVFKVVHDGLEGKKRRVPSFDGLNDITHMLLGEIAPREMKLSGPNFFFNRAGSAAVRPRKCYAAVKVADVIARMDRPIKITAGMVCLEVGMDSREHTVFVKKRKPYHMVAPSGRKRYAIWRGDLVIGRSHTQDGLIAFSNCDHELHATRSHQAFKVDETKVDKRYLFWTLRGILMTLVRVDTTGRETFSVEEILDLPMPMPPMAEQRKIGAAMDAARQKIRDAEKKARAEFEETEKRLRTFDVD